MECFPVYEVLRKRNICRQDDKNMFESFFDNESNHDLDKSHGLETFSNINDSVISNEHDVVDSNKLPTYICDFHASTNLPLSKSDSSRIVIQSNYNFMQELKEMKEFEKLTHLHNESIMTNENKYKEIASPSYDVDTLQLQNTTIQKVMHEYQVENNKLISKYNDLEIKYNNIYKDNINNLNIIELQTERIRVLENDIKHIKNQLFENEVNQRDLEKAFVECEAGLHDMEQVILHKNKIIQELEINFKNLHQLNTAKESKLNVYIYIFIYI